MSSSSEVVRVAYWLGKIEGGVNQPINTRDVPTIEDLSMRRLGGRWEVTGVQAAAD